MRVEIKKFQMNDLDYLKEDIHKMWMEHSNKEPKYISKGSLENTDVREYFRKALDKSDIVLVAVVDEDIVGIIRVEEQELEDFFNYKKAYYIDDLVVKKGFHGKGVGSELLEEVKRLAKENNIKVLKSRVYEFNNEAIGFMKKNNFRNLYSEFFSIVD